MSAGHRQRKAIRDRLLRAEGHLKGIVRMVDEGKDCPDILIQIAAVKAALDKVGRMVLVDHLESCVLEAASTGDAESQIDKLSEALSKFI
jgi:DNA-binding FrmR family transcriptional regulator